MSRKRKSHQKTELELFPFLSVLACTIGSLILLIIVVSTQTLNSNPEVKIIAQSEDGVNQKKQPRYIESKEDGVILYPNKEFVPINQLENSNSALMKLIREVARNKDQEYIIIAIRPKGIRVFEKVRNLLEKEKIDIGYEPIEEGWTLKVN